MTWALFFAGLAAVSMVLFGYAVIQAAEQAEEKDADLEALLFAEEFLDQLDAEADRWRR